MNELLIGVFSILMPLLISWLKRCDWPQEQKVLLTLAVCLVGGAVTAWADGSLDLSSTVVAFTAIFTGSQAFYKLWFEKTELNERLEQEQPL